MPTAHALTAVYFFDVQSTANRLTARAHAARAGSRLTAYELVHDGLPATLVADSAAGALLASGRVDAVVTGADRVAANGDTANKIGTLSLAVNAARCGRGPALHLLYPTLRARAGGGGRPRRTPGRCRVTATAERASSSVDAGRACAVAVGVRPRSDAHGVSMVLPAGGWTLKLTLVCACRIAGWRGRYFCSGGRLSRPGGLMTSRARRRVPFYIAAPTQTLDPAMPDGAAIPIEERAAEELTHFQGRQVAAPGIEVRGAAGAWRSGTPAPFQACRLIR
jgi:hypothetical protein